MVSAVLVINTSSTLAILVRNKVWFLHSGLELSLFLEEATFSSLLIKPSTKAHYKLCLEQLGQPERP